MKLVIFGLTVSSSWGNGHATLWRGLCSALARRGHQVVFFERDTSYYAEHRDLTELPGGRLRLYTSWADTVLAAATELADADAGVVTSYCPDGIPAGALVQESPALSVFYDLDTPVTLDAVRRGLTVPFVGSRGLADFDLVLSYTGGRALDELRTLLGARRVEPLYGSVDPAAHRPVPGEPELACDLSYLGTYAADRQDTLEALFIEPARREAQRRFLIGGAQYPARFPWTGNIFFIHHVPPARHPAFFCSSRLTLNATRLPMKQMGYCPSGRLFEAAACGVPILSDSWEGLETFFAPDEEILIAADAAAAVAALRRPDAELAEIGRRARARALAQHTAEHRAAELEDLLAAALVA